MGITRGFLGRLHEAVGVMVRHERILPPGRQVAEVVTSEAGPFARQSVDQLIAIMQASTAGVAGQMNLQLSPAEARAHFYRWTFTAATTVASAVLMVPWAVEVRNSKGEWEPEPGHELEELLRRGNAFWTGPELEYWTIVELCLTGTCFWRLVPNALWEPFAIWPMVGTVKPKLDAEGTVLGWRNEAFVGGKREVRELEPGEVVYLRLPKPGDLYGGFGPAQAAGGSIKLDDEIINSEWASFKQGVFPSALVFMTEPDKERRQQAMEEFNEMYAGTKHSAKAIGALNPEKVKIEWPPWKPREMGYDKGADRTSKEIMAAHRVPRALAGLSDDYNRANIEGAEYIFARYTTAPWLTLLDARIDQDLVVPHYGEDTRFRHASPVLEDKAFVQLQESGDLTMGVVNVDTLRARRGLPAREDGRGGLYYQPVSVMVSGEARAPGGAFGAGERQRTDAGAGSRPQAQRRIMSGQFMEHKFGLEVRIRKLWATYFRGLSKRVSAAIDEARTGAQRASARKTLDDVPAWLDRLLDPGDLAGEMAAMMKPAVREGIVLGGSFERGFSPTPDLMPWDGSMAAVDRYAAGFGKAHHVEVAGTTRKAIQDTVLEGLRQNETWDELKKRVVDEFGQMAESRAANIATTESTKLYGAGGQGFREEYEVPEKEWICSWVNSRPTHQEADGQVRKNGEAFDVGADHMQWPGEGYMAEENCNCNCSAVGHYPTKKE